MSYDRCIHCGGIAFKTDGNADAICYNMAFYGNCEGCNPKYLLLKVGPNEKCPCGSGLKNKKCHNYKRQPQ